MLHRSPVGPEQNGQTDQRGPLVIGDDVVATRGMSSGKIVQLLGHWGNNRKKRERVE